MRPERWQRVEKLFGFALELPRDERLAFLRAECGADQELYDEVVSLLEVDRVSDGRLTGLTHDPWLRRRRPCNPS